MVFEIENTKRTKLWRLNKWQHLHFYDNFYSLLFLRLSTFHLNATTGFFSSQWLVVLQTWGRQLGASPAKINDYLEKFDVHILFLADTGDQSAWHDDLFKKLQNSRCVGYIKVEEKVSFVRQKTREGRNSSPWNRSRPKHHFPAWERM